MANYIMLITESQKAFDDCNVLIPAYQKLDANTQKQAQYQAIQIVNEIGIEYVDAVELLTVRTSTMLAKSVTLTEVPPVAPQTQENN